MTARLRVGLVGGGPWARDVHAPALAAHDDFELAGVWTRRPAVAAALAEAHGTVPFDDVDAMIAAVDVVACCVPPEVQAPVAGRAARAGRHLILEKPIAGSLAGAEALVADVDGAGVASVIALVLRYASETRDWLANVHAAGPWAGGNVRWISGKLLDRDAPPSPWRHAAGAIADIGPHTFDVVDAALGPIVEVAGASHSEGDLWHVILRHDGGATSSVTLSLKTPVDPSIVEIDVYGGAGRCALSARRTPPRAAYATMLDELAVMIRSGTTVHPCDVHRGLHLQRVIERARELAGRS